MTASLTNGVITILDAALQPLVPFNAGGMVVDVTGNGIASAQVVIFNTSFTFNATTDANGNYTINNMYEANTSQARQNKIFGSPTFIYEGEIFWGDDRMEDSIKWAKNL